MVPRERPGLLMTKTKKVKAATASEKILVERGQTGVRLEKRLLTLHFMTCQEKFKKNPAMNYLEQIKIKVFLRHIPFPWMSRMEYGNGWKRRKITTS